MNFDPIIALGTLLLNAVLSLSFFMPAMILAYVFEFLWNVMKDLIKCKFHNLMFWKKQEPKQYPHDYSILITGAGTGIGRGLAVEYVKKFVKIVEDDEGKSKDFKFQIFCVSRTAKTLETTKEKCEKIMKERETANEQAGKKPALNLFSKISVQIFPDTDVSDQEGYKSVYEKCCNLTSQKSIDLVIANAGIAPLCDKAKFDESSKTGSHEEKLLSSFQKWQKVTLQTKDVNIDGVMYTMFAAIEQFFKAQAEAAKDTNSHVSAVRPPQIGVISSLNAYTPNWAGVYGMTKKSVLDFSCYMRNNVKHLGIKINAIVPGMVKTEFQRAILNEKHGTADKESLEKVKKEMKAMMTAKYAAAQYIIPKLEENKQIIFFNFFTWALVQFMSTIPLHFDRWFFEPLQSTIRQELESAVYFVQRDLPKKAEESKKQK